MNLQERVSFLKDTDILRQATQGLLEQVAAQMEEVAGESGSALFRDGDVGDAVYFLVEGGLRVEKQGVTILTRGKGECIGEFSLIDDAPRSADAIAEGDIHLLRWLREDFQASLASNPAVAGGILKVLLTKLREDIALHVEAGLEYERVMQDLRRAHEIQMGMLPGSDLIDDRIEISGYCKPAENVGGDYFDYVKTDDGRYSIILGDVTDHGFYSGLFVAMAKNCYQTRTDYSPERVMGAMNRSVALSMQDSMLMTCCAILIDAGEGTLTYTNAGHNPPILLSGFEINELESTDMLLGVPGFEDRPFATRTMPWRSGDVLVVYSDGITESANAGGEMFEEERLLETVKQGRGSTASDVKGAVLDAVNVFAEDEPQADDVTIVVARAL